MLQRTDPFGKQVTFHPPYKRIISLIPSISESLFELGAADRLLAITSYCVSPLKQTRMKEKIGGTKNPDLEKIRMLEPDLIIANVEENRKEDVEACAQFCDVYLNYPKRVSDTVRLLSDLGVLTESDAQPFITDIKHAVESIPRRKPQMTIYLIWNNPYWSIGEDTYIADMLRIQHLTNAFSSRTERYFPVSEKEMARDDPDVILLPSEPFRFRGIHREEIALALQSTPAVRNGRVYLIDGKMTSWFGTRTARGIDYLNRILS